MAYIGNSPENVLQARTAEYEYTATAGQTAFSGVDNNGLSLDLLLANQNEVYLNGSRLVSDDDFTVSGDTLTLTVAAAAGDILVIKTQTEVSNIASYTKAEADSRYVNYSGDIVAGDLQISGEVDAGSLIVDTDVLVVDATNNRVGVGTASPGNLLHVNSAVNNGAVITLESTAVDSYPFLRLKNDAREYQVTNHGPLGDKFTVYDGTAGSHRFVIDASGNVGIGTSSVVSGFKLDVVGDARFSDVAGDDGVELGWSAGGSQGFVQAYDRGASAFRNLNLNGAVTITSTGNVGIGTENPSAPLEVHHATVPVLKIKATTASGQAALYLDGYSDGGTQRASRINFRKDTTNEWSIINDYDQNDSNKLDFEYAGSRKVTLTSSGRVGIGTSSPGTYLHIAGTDEGLYVQREYGGSPHIRFRGHQGTVSSPSTVVNGQRVGQLSFEPMFSSGVFGEHTGIYGAVNGTVTSSNIPTDLVFSAGQNSSISNNKRMHLYGSDGAFSVGRRGSTNHQMRFSVGHTANTYGNVLHYVALGGGANHVDSSNPQYKIRIQINRNVMYYKGFTLELFADSGFDWGGHGYCQYYGKFMISFSGTVGHAIHIIENQGYNYLQGTGVYYYDATSGFYDTNYYYVDLRFASNQSPGGSPSGFRPDFSAIVHQNNDIVNAVGVVN